jgi:hypothetical protein
VRKHVFLQISLNKGFAMKNRIFLSTIVIALIHLLAIPSFALKYKIVPSIGVKETYDTKVGYTDEDDFIHSIISGLVYDASTMTSKVHFSGTVDYSWYNEESEYDGFDQTYDLDLFHDFSERFSFGMKNNFMYDTNSKRSFEETGEDLHSVDRIMYGVSPYFIFDIDERTMSRISYKVKGSDYQGYSNDDTYSDSMVHSFGASVERDLTELFTMGIAASADLRSYEKEQGENHYDHYKLSLLSKYRFSERTRLRFSVSTDQFYENEVNDDSDTTQSVNVSAGANHAVNEQCSLDVFIGTGDQTTFDESGTLGFDLTWKEETWSVAGGYKRDVTSGARGYDLDRDRVHVTAEYLASERLLYGVQGVYVYSDQTDTDDNDEERYTYYGMEPYLQYEIIKNSFIKAGYSYGVYMDRDDDRDITRNKVYVMYTMAFPYEK